MKIKPHALIATTALSLLTAFPSLSQASVLFFAGNLRTDANVTNCGSGCTLRTANSNSDFAQWAVVVKTFTVTQTTTMEAVTYSYAGGTSESGAAVSAGGLEPYLSLFNAQGDFLTSTYFGTTCPIGAASHDGNCFDVSLDGGVLTPGTYTIALSAYQNMSIAENNGAPATLADGFTGFGILAAGENLNYAFDVILPSEPSIPEPPSLATFLSGFSAFLFYRCLRRATRHQIWRIPMKNKLFALTGNACAPHCP